MLALALGLAAFAAASDWRYVVPPEGHALRRPRLTALPLSPEPPEELRVDVAFRGAWQRYGMLRYGDPDTARIAVVLDHLSTTEVDLYVDAERGLSIDERDRVEGDGRVFELSLAVATRDEEGRDLLVPRRVRFELGRSGAILGVATLGWIEGEVELEGTRLRCLRRDGDANGFFGDALDQVWLDRDASGDFAPLRELFVVQPILSLDERRYALRSDRLGSRLQLELLEGTGRVALALPGPDGAPRADLVDVLALLVGRDGSAVLVRAPGEPTELPIGEYRLGMVTLRLGDPVRPWSFVFSEAYGAERAQWRAVEKDAELALDPMGALELGVHPFAGAVAPGDGLTVRLTLYTGDGLLINTAYRGIEAPVHSLGGLQAEIALVDDSGEVLATQSSGFA